MKFNVTIDLKQGRGSAGRPNVSAIGSRREITWSAPCFSLPRDDNKIVLFVTEEKQASAEQYADRLSGKTLDWDGPTDHFAEDRMLNAASSGDEIHLFHRERHHTDFTYCGRLSVASHVLRTDRPSHFKFQVI